MNALLEYTSNDEGSSGEDSVALHELVKKPGIHPCTWDNATFEHYARQNKRKQPHYTRSQLKKMRAHRRDAVDHEEEPLPPQTFAPVIKVHEEPKPEAIASSQFTGLKQFDYLGRTYMHIPRDLDVTLTKKPGSIENFVPKKIAFTLAGHAKGVTKLALFPQLGHLLLSCGNDAKIRLWDMYHRHEQLRVFNGHAQAVKTIAFNKSGDRFLSGGYDRRVIMWETELGSIRAQFTVPAVANAVCFNPNNEDEFLVGLANHKIEHYSLKAGMAPIQTYTHHLGAVNSLTVVEGGARFMSSADDKSVRVWDWQVDIPVKCISDPVLHSMPTAVVYPSQEFIALQSMDNVVKVIKGSGKFRFVNSKRFTGHRLAGHGIGIDISPDGKIITSGDSRGLLFFWDWKTSRIISRLKLDSVPISCVSFHTQETSLVVAAGSGGKIYCCR